MHTRSARLLPLALLLVTLTTSGCLYSREIAQTRRDIEKAYPDLHLKREFVMSFGPGSLGFARWVTGLVRDEDARFASNLLENVRRVKLGVYEIVGETPDYSQYDVPGLRRFQRDGWETAVRVRETDGAREDAEHVWIMYREHRDRIENMFLAVLDGENLVLIRLDGDLEGILKTVMEKDPVFWNE